ncbi:unnamed protein product [Camellia sinensis]
MYSRSPSLYATESRSRSRSKSRSWSRLRGKSRSRSRSRGRGSYDNSGFLSWNDVGNPGNTLYVTGLSTRVTERELKDHFSKEGKVASCFLVVEPRTRSSCSFAFITMDTVDDANRCIKRLMLLVADGCCLLVCYSCWFSAIAAGFVAAAAACCCEAAATRCWSAANLCVPHGREILVFLDGPP